MISPPPLTPLTARATEIVSVARAILEEQGYEAVTMRTIAERLGIRAPSLYKHMPDKAALESAIIEQGLLELGTAMHAAVSVERLRDATTAVLAAYRDYALSRPNLYRLATSGLLDRSRLAPGLEEWTGAAFHLAAGDPYRGQAMWAFAHGMVILEIDRRFWDTDLDRTWREGARVFTSPSGGAREPHL